MAKLIIGCGYLGWPMAAAWLEKGHEVFAVTRSPAKANELKTRGVRPILGDVTQSHSLPRLPAADTVLHALGFDRSEQQSIQQVFLNGLENVLKCIDTTSLKQLFFISSTGVYAQQEGQWVDEQSDCQPVREGGRACLAAEEMLRSHPLIARATILRLAGLYGPGRIPRRRELSQGLPLDAPTDGYLNLIHVDDVVRIILRLEMLGPEMLGPEKSVSRPDLLLVADGNPVQRIDYYRELARLLEAPPPQFTTPATDSPSTRRATGSDKRISNRRLLAELNVTLRFPTYREGLAAILREEANRDAVN